MGGGIFIALWVLGTGGGGTVIVPAASDVRAGVSYDAAHLPAPADVRAGVVYG